MIKLPPKVVSKKEEDDEEGDFVQPSAAAPTTV